MSAVYNTLVSIICKKELNRSSIGVMIPVHTLQLVSDLHAAHIKFLIFFQQHVWIDSHPNVERKGLLRVVKEEWIQCTQQVSYMGKRCFIVSFCLAGRMQTNTGSAEIQFPVWFSWWWDFPSSSQPSGKSPTQARGGQCRSVHRGGCCFLRQKGNVLLSIWFWDVQDNQVTHILLIIWNHGLACRLVSSCCHMHGLTIFFTLKFFCCLLD